MTALLRGRTSLNDFRLFVTTDRASRILVPTAVSHQAGIIKWEFEYKITRLLDRVRDFKLIMPSGRDYPKRGPSVRDPAGITIATGDNLFLNYTVHYNEEHAASLDDAELTRFIQKWIDEQ